MISPERYSLWKKGSFKGREVLENVQNSKEREGELNKRGIESREDTLERLDRSREEEVQKYN